MGTGLGLGIGIPFRRMGGGAANTARTQAFLTATGITDATIISALNAMDNELITAGLLPSGTGAGKIIALYPIVGGTASTHKFNFVNPLDTDAAYRLTFNGGFTHDANGLTGNGTNNFANTYLNTINFGLDSFAFGVYSRTDSNGDFYDFGNFSSATTPANCGSNIQSRFVNFLFGRINQDDSPTVANTDSKGFFAKSRVNSTQEIACIRGTNTTQAKTSKDRANLNMYFTALNFNGARFGSSDRNYSFAFASEGLNTTELSALNTIVIAYQTALGRNV
jgi:hypothetical protein